MRPLTHFRTLTFAAAFVALASAAHAAPTSGTETPSQRADRLFDESKPLLEAGRYAEACPKLSESQSLDPATGTLLALALCHEGEGKTASAYAELGDVVVQAAKEKRTDRVKLATQHLSKLTPILSHIELTVPPELTTTPGLSIELDGRTVPAAEWNHAAPADPGDHVVGASAPGHVAWHAAFVLPKLETRTITIGPLDAVAPPAAPTRVDIEAPWKRRAGLITVAGGGIALLVGAVVGIDALVQEGTVKDLCPTLKCPAGSAAAEKSQTVQTEASITDVALGVGLVAVGVGTYLFVTAPKAEKTVGLQLVPVLAWGRAGASLTYRF